MESFQDSNCCSLSGNFSLYERYMRSFKVGDHLSENNPTRDLCERPPMNSPSSDSRSNIDLITVVQSSFVNKYNERTESDCVRNTATCDNLVGRVSSLDIDLCAKIGSPCTSSLENSSATVDQCLLQDKSNHTDVNISSEESKAANKQPVFITPTMENSNNAVDSVPLFRNVTTPSESVFKLPINELSFIGTIKHVKKLKPIVDPITAFSTSNGLENLDERSGEVAVSDNESDDSKCYINKNIMEDLCYLNVAEKVSDCTRTFLSSESNKKDIVVSEEETAAKWNSDQSYTSFDASFDSGVRSPDMFSDDDDDNNEKFVESEPFWSFLKDYELYERNKVKKTEEILHGVLPPPSVTILKTDVTEMLKKYYSFLPLFNDTLKDDVSEVNSVTPTKRVSFVEIPQQVMQPDILNETVNQVSCSTSNVEKSKSEDIMNTSHESDIHVNNKSVELKMGTKTEAVETAWPHVLKCKYHDVYYNMTKYSEKYELLVLRYGERYVGAETDTSVNIYSGGLQSPSSANKRKALRLKLAQAKSPGRRLSHLARRRQAFCSAATISEKAQSSTAKMVLIDRNFFPHRKFISSAERKSPRLRRTPGKKTPTRRTPGKKTPVKTPKTRSGGSSKKKAMRRLLMDSETITRTQPSRETLKRALFISPENGKVPQNLSASVPSHTMKSRQRLFGSPVRSADTKSSDGTQSDQFLKRKLDSLDYEPESSKSKIAKSLSFGGDNIGGSQSIAFTRRSSEVFSTNNIAELNETHKKKLLWAVSEALRVHGWRMSSPGFREKASALARLTRRLLALPEHMAKLAAPKLSTSETMLKLARQYVFAIIQGRSVDDCYLEEQAKLANEANSKITGYISAGAYQLKISQSTSTFTSQIKENTWKDASIRLEQSKSGPKNVLQDKLINVDANSNSSSGMSVFDKPSLGLFKSNSMPSFEEAAKLRVRRQISFDNANFPKR